MAIAAIQMSFSPNPKSVIVVFLRLFFSFGANLLNKAAFS
jgi:hypothetical protein